MALGATVKVESVAAQGPLFVDRITQVGDGAYPAGGTAAFLAKFRLAVNDPARNIMMVKDEGILADAVEYDHANDKLFVRVKATGVESAVANQSGVTYSMVVISY